MPRVDNETAGKRFIALLIALLLIASFIYAISHLIVEETVPCQTKDDAFNPCGDSTCSENMDKLSWQNFARIDAKGRVSLRNVGDIDWYVGGNRVKEILTQIRDRTEEMDRARMDLEKQLDEFAVGMLDRKPVDLLSETILMGDYQKAYVQLNELSKEISNSDIGSMKILLLTLDQKMQAQCNTLDDLSPPLSRMFFWTTPILSVFEVLFWSLFGVLTNLLVNSAEYLRKGTFKPVETWVAYTKLVYGPILAVVLVIAIINGFFGIESYQVRVWTLPLIGFLFGYASRRTANLVDKLIERFMGKAEEGIAAGPEAVAKKRIAMIKELKETLRPRNMDELRHQAKKLAKEVTASAVEGKGGSR